MFNEPIISNLTEVMTSGVGSIVASIGLVIIFGTIIGKYLEKTGAAVTMGELILKWTGDRYPALSMSIIGWIVSIPVFCDSGYVMLSSLSKTVAKKSNINVLFQVFLLLQAYMRHILSFPQLQVQSQLLVT